MEKMNYKELRKVEPKNIPVFKRLFECRKEIERLNCVLVKGMVSKKMFDELVLKENKLCKEFTEMDRTIWRNYPFYNEKAIKWHENFFLLLGEELEKIQKKFKFKKCKWCDRLYNEQEDFCPTEECQYHYY